MRTTHAKHLASSHLHVGVLETLCAVLLHLIARVYFAHGNTWPRASQRLYDHLSHALSSKCLAALEFLALEPSKRIENRSKQQEDGCYNQTGSLRPDADPLYSTHDKVNGSAHVVGAEFANERVEFGRGRADAEEQGYLNEDDDERADSVQCKLAVTLSTPRDLAATYKQTMLNAMTKVAWKMFDIPSAKQRNMHSTPVLCR